MHIRYVGDSSYGSLMNSSDNLAEFVSEVLHVDPHGALPSRLTDQWLSDLLNSLEKLFLRGDDSEMSKPLAAVIQILCEKCQSDKVTVPIDEMERLLQHYMLELALEKISRTTEIHVEPATLEDIFEPDRVVTVRRMLEA